MKHIFKLSVLTTAIFLAGCGDETESTGATSTSKYEAHIQESLSQPTNIKFNLSGSDASVPLPSFALMDSTDGTLGIPTSGDDALTNPLAAMNTADGYSTTMPIILTFEGAGFATAAVSNGVYVIELTESMTGSPGVERVLTNGTDFSVVSSGTSLVISFTKDLNASSEYIFAVTNDVVDANGDAVGMSSSYAALKSTSTMYSEGSLAQAQQVTQGVEGIFGLSGVVGDPTTIIYSSWFSTQSVGDSLYATKAATATGLGGTGLNDVWKDSANPNDVDLSTAYAMQFGATQEFSAALNTDEDFDKYIGEGDAAKTATLKASINALYGGSGATIDVTQGFVQLPHYLEKSESSWNSQPFESAMPSLAKVSSALSDPAEATHMATQLVTAGIDPTLLATSQTEQLKLIGLNLTLVDGTALDSERVITRYSPVPQVKSLETVEFLLFTPNGSDPTDVVIYQHGITSAKENAYAFAYNMANAGLAVLAIDLPIHGTRSLDDTRSANSNTSAYLNLTYLPVARDNVRQSVLDVMGLRTSLTASYSANLLAASPLKGFTPASEVKLLGHSLGGIVGTTAVATANRTLGSDQADALYTFAAASIQNSGGQISNLLLGSTEFGPEVKHSIASSASSQYASFASDNCGSLDDKTCYETFEGLATTEQLAVMDSAFQQFAYAAQTVLDTIDPYTNASHLLSSGEPVLPIYMGQAQGDETVPNTVDGAPFAGTTPLATKLELTVVDSSSTSPNGVKDFVKFSEVAEHSTFVAPQDDSTPLPLDFAHHTGMQTQLVDFMLDNDLGSVDNSSSILE
ncbi:VolA/Pla-1 family phospholipase [Vibrio profundi]|uniref:VolA/Pla-1 family phospholipase n=1 Tax=Vibrio profundi TaxID=1774960 RepID=UPI003736A152